MNERIRNALDKGAFVIVSVDGGSIFYWDLVSYDVYGELSDAEKSLEFFKEGGGDETLVILQLVEPPATALIEVLGGVASADDLGTSAGISVNIVDYDIDEEDDDKGR